ncbi:hypothetical protein FUA23_00915 [Neolewinella aurantiaca]|uniref:Uncharacterized protein n=1 Tax=Neolewinella aurantiaca TaxID=2602767 RepID=A0A5C7FKA3_9BACT|nr:hypothetical protein [Neolewinella aurantiaca]TXF91778.1 hypothetical protein FUA23_00915 [Neolewinella aurantiaca]
MRLLPFLLFLLPVVLVGQPSLFDVLHADNDTVVFRIETDWNGLVRRKMDKAYQPATVHLTLGDSTLTFEAKLRSRGNIRLEVCQNPSLKLKLRKDELLAAGFSDLNEFKFVLQCTNNSLGESYLTREKLVYDLHAVYSNYTHRTLAVGLDLGKGDTTKAFLVEHDEQMEARFNAKVLEVNKMSTRGLHREAYVNMCLFNYLILNTDWHVFNLHNLKFVCPEGTNDFIPVPYDFDYSGFVGAHYAVPREELGISTIYVPKWLGKRVTEDEISSAAAHFLAQREKTEALINEHPCLHKRDQKRLLRRVSDFYKLLENEKHLLKLVE